MYLTGLTCVKSPAFKIVSSTNPSWIVLPNPNNHFAGLNIKSIPFKFMLMFGHLNPFLNSVGRTLVHRCGINSVCPHILPAFIFISYFIQERLFLSFPVFSILSIHEYSGTSRLGFSNTLFNGTITRKIQNQYAVQILLNVI